MKQPKFEVGQKVKFSGDHDKMAGEVVSFTFDSETGYTYRVSSKYFDPEKNDMVKGLKILKEDEIVDMTDIEEAELNK